jgi:predicted PurR-regulated permease PerM
MTNKRILTATLTILGTLGLAYLMVRIWQILLVLFLSIVFASTIRPAIEWLEHHGLSRVLSIILLYVLIFGTIGGLLFFVIPSLVDMGIALFVNGQLMDHLHQLAGQLSLFGWKKFGIFLPVFTLPDKLQAFLQSIAGDAGQQALPIAKGTILTLGQIVLVFVMAFYWLTARSRILDLLLRLTPLRSRETAQNMWTDVENTLGAYTRGQVILMVAIGVACLAGLLVLGVPYALPLAVIAALMEAIPLAGPILGAIPAVLVGLTVSGPTALFVIGWYVLVQQVEGHILVPRIMHRAVGLNPLLVIIALIAGGIIDGIVGALVAIPIAAAVQIIVQRLLIDPAILSRLPRIRNGIVIFGEDDLEKTEAPAEEITGENHLKYDSIERRPSSR